MGNSLEYKLAVLDSQQHWVLGIETCCNQRSLIQNTNLKWDVSECISGFGKRYSGMKAHISEMTKHPSVSSYGVKKKPAT